MFHTHISFIHHGHQITFFLPWRNNLQWAKASSLSRIHDQTQTHHTWYDSSGRVTSPTQRPLPDNTQHSQETDIHTPSGIRTHIPSKRAANEIGLYNLSEMLNKTSLPSPPLPLMLQKHSS